MDEPVAVDLNVLMMSLCFAAKRNENSLQWSIDQNTECRAENMSTPYSA